MKYLKPSIPKPIIRADTNSSTSDCCSHDGFSFLQFHNLSLRIATVAITGLLTLAACATPPPPNEALQAAELAITSAEQARVADYASLELGEARLKLAAARTAAQEKEMITAQRLAEQSKVDAELALARANVAKAQIVNDEMKKSTETMKHEMQRNTGASQ